MKPRAHILIVEDESLVADDLEQRLIKLGYRSVGIVDTGEAAVTQALELRPDLVLMDIRLKGPLDGIEAAGQLRVPHRIPVVFLTSHADQGTLERAGLSEPFGYLTKPFQERDLHATLEMALYRHHAEERLLKIERWLATTLRNIADAVIATDTAGRVTYLNPSAELLTGWTMHEALGQLWDRVFQVRAADTNLPIRDLLSRALAEGIVVELGSGANLTTRAGRSVPVDDSVAPIRDDAGQLIGCVICARDATERREMETTMLNHNQRLEGRVLERTAELESANQRLQAANKELEVVTYSISHDLRAPLRAITGFATMLEEEHASVLDERGLRLLRFVTDNSKKMGEMIDGFLALMRLGRQGVKPEAVNMSALVADVVETLWAAHLGNQARLEAAPLPAAVGDPVLLRQVWANLLENALKFSAEREPPVITVRGQETDTEWVYSVSDNGVGFDPNYAGKLFCTFHRLHAEARFPGHGLGLASAHRIVTLHGGRIWAESEPGRGATFHFALPAAVGAIEVRQP